MDLPSVGELVVILDALDATAIGQVGETLGVRRAQRYNNSDRCTIVNWIQVSARVGDGFGWSDTGVEYTDAFAWRVPTPDEVAQYSMSADPEVEL